MIKQRGITLAYEVRRSDGDVVGFHSSAKGAYKRARENLGGEMAHLSFKSIIHMPASSSDRKTATEKAVVKELHKNSFIRIESMTPHYHWITIQVHPLLRG